MKRRQLLNTILVLSIILACLLAVAGMRLLQPQNPTLQNSTPGTAQSTTQPTPPATTVPAPPVTDPPTEPTEPPIVKETTATIGATGDILLHDKVILSGYDKATGTFDYSYIFDHFSQYTQTVDYAVANLEVTLYHKPGTGFQGYNGYPKFNAPDEIVDALKSAGFDMLLTANNHAYDSGHDGFIRTQQVIAQKGLAHIGTRLTTEDKPYKIVDVNGISIGMINYTYDTTLHTNGSLSLNTIRLKEADAALINSFSDRAPKEFSWQIQDHLDAFYAQLQGQLEAMRAEGAEAIVLYIHWGDEYHTYTNDTQKKMAQALCNLGIDVIVGNHAHVQQPVELLTNQNDPDKKTVCLYSTGNSVSNISRDDKIFPINCEDGMLFTFTFAKYSDGTVLVESADILPTWVHRYDEASVRKFQILTLDREIEDWKAELGISDKVLAECQDSYDRTMDVVGAGLAQANEYYAQNQAEVEAALGIQ